METDSDIRYSKPLTLVDISGAEFAKEMLAGDPTYGINLDRIQFDSETQSFTIIELLLCNESQPHVTPHTSHPNRYFHKNRQKFISLWSLARRLDARLYLVNYAKAGTTHADQVRILRVTDIIPTSPTSPVVTDEDLKLSRLEYSQWFRSLNSRGKK